MKTNNILRTIFSAVLLISAIFALYFLFTIDIASANACSSNFDCGTNGYRGSPYCQGNSLYQNYKTYTCNNPGTTYSSCSQSTVSQLILNCTGNQTCSNGSCTANCTSHYNQRCVGSSVYWYDSCGNQQELYQYCQYNQTCSNGYCSTQNCAYHYATRCYNNAVYWYDSCWNRQDLYQTCQYGCQNNQCVQNTCISHVNTRCVGNFVYWYDSCDNRQDLVKNCSYGCQYGQCINYQPTYTKHYIKSCNNNNLYWYDSNGASNDVYKNCSDNNQCTADGCANSQCVNQARCDGSTCAVGSADYCSTCKHVGDGVCNCDETPCSAPSDCKASTGGGLDTSTFCEVESTSANWSKNITVTAGQNISCLIIIKNTSATSINDVTVRADIPVEIVGTSELKIDGKAFNGNITSGINLGNFSSNVSKTIVFEGKTQSPITQVSAKQIIGIASSGALSSSDSLVINFQPTVAGAATASLESSSFAEFFKRWYIWILIALVLIFLFIVIFRRLSSSI